MTEVSIKSHNWGTSMSIFESRDVTHYGVKSLIPPKPSVADHCLSWLAFFQCCILVPSFPKVSNAQTHCHPYDVRKIRPPSFIALWFNSDAHVLIVGAFFLAVDTSQHGPPDWSVTTQSHKQQMSMYCVFRHLFI